MPTNTPCIIRLQRPERRNSLDGHALRHLREALGDAAGRTVVFVAEGPAFCAGFDLDWLGEQFDRPGGIERAVAALVRLYRRILSHDAPTIAVVNGPAVGGGVGLAVCCDQVLVTPAARFGLPGGVMAPLAGLVLPYAHRRCPAWDGRDVDAGEAKRLGIADQLIEREAEWDQAIDAGLRSTQRRRPTGASVRDRIRQLLLPENLDAIRPSLRARSSARANPGSRP